MAKKWRCRVRGCRLDEKAHARKYAWIEETEGRMAADEFDRKHAPEEQED